MQGAEMVLDRKIVISCPIDSDVAGQVVSQIMAINDFDKQMSVVTTYEPQPIEMFINSGGGGATDGFAIIGAMEMSETPIITYGLGIVGSMALGIFVKGDYRVSSRFTRYMYHSVAYGTMGHIKDHEDSHKEADILQRMYNSLFEDTGITKEMMKSARDKKEDLFFSPRQAEKLGFVDAIIKKPEKKIASINDLDEEELLAIQKQLEKLKK